MFLPYATLGSPRINTDATGQVISRHDYYPFGEEIARTGYGSDTIRTQFTGYERDGETGLDYAKARYHNSSFGRFSSPDPLMESGRPYLPQSWNRYVYVLNNPIRFTDPFGLSEQGGTKIVHRERRPVIVTENLNVAISVEPSQTVPPKEYKDLETGETITRNVFEVGVILSDPNGQPLPGSAFTFQTVGLDENGKPYSSQASTVERQADGTLKSVSGPATENYTEPGEPYRITANSDGSDNTTLNPETGDVQSDRHRSRITTNSGGVATVDFATTRFNGNVSLDPAYDRSLPLGSSRVGYVAGDVPPVPRQRGGVQSILLGNALGINR